jgi:hypothetical protein
MYRTPLALVGLSFLLIPLVSQGGEWSLKGSVDQGLSYDDNVRMLGKNQVIPNNQPKEPRGSFQYRILPAITFQHKTDVSEVHADVLYGIQIYTDIPELDQKIQNYGIGGLYKTEKFDWGLTSNLSITPSRNTALQNGGGFNTNSDMTTWSVSPSLSYKIDDINSLILSPTYSETTFSNSGSATPQTNGFNNNFNNYDSTNVDLTWQRLWTDRYTSGVSLFYNNYNTQLQANNGGSPTPSSFDSVGLNFSNDYAWSENWKLEGTIGVRHTESNVGKVNSSSFGFLADTGINYTGESFTSGISFNRSLTPSNQGQLQEQTSVGLNFDYQILERLSASFTTSYQAYDLVNTNQSNNQTTRENIIIQPSVKLMLSPDWALAGTYRYRTQDGGAFNTPIGGNSFNGTADSNLFMLSINYNWKGFKLSR